MKTIDREVYFLKYFADKLPVPQIVQEVPPEADIRGAILMECLPGELLKTTTMTDALAYEMGALLAKIHINPAPGYGDLTQPESLSLDPRVYLTQKFEEGMHECHHHLPKELIEQCRHYYETHIHLLDSVDGPCMIHRDFRPGNVIVREGQIQGIIDWAGGRGSFAEEDFCPIEHWEWPMLPNSKQSFFEGYASIRPVPNYSAVMPLLRINRALNVLGFTIKHGTWKTHFARVYAFNRQFLESFLKVKDISQYSKLLERIHSMMIGRKSPLLVALDGRSGVGKSTLAQFIAQEVGGVVVQGDDFFAGGPDGEWDARSVEAKVADCIDWRRLRKEVLEPLLAGQPASWHPFDFISGIGLSEEVKHCKPAAVIILDGAYSCRPELADIVDLSVLIEMSDDKLRRERLLNREGHDFMTAWHLRWNAAEDHYFTEVVHRSRFDLILTIR